MDTATAQSTLIAAGFQVSISSGYSDTVPMGYVISQMPPGNSEAEPNAVIEIVVSLGEEPAMPTWPSSGEGNPFWPWGNP